MRLLPRITAWLLLTSLMATAQTATVDFTFNPNDLGFDHGSGADGLISATAVQADGKILFGGSLNYYNGYAANALCRINPDGEIDSSFISALNCGNCNNASVAAIALQPDGKILIGGGDFFNPSTGVARLLSDGSLDPSFALPSVSADVRALVLQPDGKILIGGDFTSIDGISRNRIARLNTDGSVDLSFNPNVGANGQVYDVALQDDGKIIIAGNFTSYNGIARIRIARLHSDGTLDQSFNPGNGADDRIYTVGIQANGKIFIGGLFWSVNGSQQRRIARLNIDGTLDTSFNVGTALLGGVEVLQVQSDGKVVIGGTFTSFNGISHQRLMRLNPNGSPDASFTIGEGADNNIFSILSLQNGDLIIGGSFDFFDRNPRKGLARVLSNGQFDHSFNPGSGANNNVLVLLQQPDGKMIAGGHFTNWNGHTKHRIVRFNTDGSADQSFDPGAGAVNNNNLNSGSVYALALQADGKIWVGGEFSSYNNSSKDGIVRVNPDGSQDMTFAGSGITGINASVRDITLQPDGKGVIVGSFDFYNGVARENIARLNTDGALDLSFDAGSINGLINTVVIQPDGKSIIGGTFSFINGQSIRALARLNSDGSIDNGFNANLVAGSSVQDLLLMPNGQILVGCNVEHSNGNHYMLMRLNADGSLDNNFSHVQKPAFSSERVDAVRIQSDGKLLIGGNFQNIHSINRNRFARLNADGSLDITYDVGQGPNSGVVALLVQSDDAIVIGGGFTAFNGIGRNRIARIIENQVIPCDSLWNTDAIQLNNDSIQIDWQANNATNFTLYYRSVNSSNWQTIALTDSSYTLVGLPTGAHAYYLENTVSGATSCPDTFEVSYTCVIGAPSNVQILAIASFEAVVAFSPLSPNSSAWLIEYGSPGFSEGTGTIVSTTFTTDTLAFISDSDYELLVYEILANGDTSCASDRIAFRTRCFSSTPPLLEEFTAWAPTCWRVDEGDTTAIQSQNDYLHFLSDDNAIVSSPPVNLFSAAEVRFNWSHFNAAAGDRLVLTVRKLLSTAYDTLLDLNGANFHLPTATAHQPAPKADFIQETVQLIDANYNFAEVIFELHYTADGGSDAFIDFFEINDLQICLPPTNLSAVAIDDTSVALSWNQGSFMNFNWVLEYGPTGFTPGTGTERNLFTTADTIGGLSACSSYDFYLREVCMMMMDTSAYGNPLTVNTNCSACSDLFDATATIPGNYRVDLSWNVTGAASYQIWYQLNGDIAWSQLNATTNARSLFPIAPGLYNYYITDPGTGDSSCMGQFTVNCEDFGYSVNTFQIVDATKGKVNVFGVTGGRRTWDFGLDDGTDTTWLTNSFSRRFLNLDPGTYSIHLKDYFDCYSSQVATVTIDPVDSSVIPILTTVQNLGGGSLRPVWTVSDPSRIDRYQVRVKDMTAGGLGTLYQTYIALGGTTTSFTINGLPPARYRIDVRGRVDGAFANGIYSNYRERIVSSNKDETTNSTELSEENQIILYPNPTNDLLHVQAPESSELVLMDLNGKRIAVRITKLAEEVFDLRELAQGVYILQLSIGERIYRERLIRN